MKCSECRYSAFGHYDSLSYICDGCRNEPDVGFFGFTDNYLNKHFNSEEEREQYIDKYGDFPVEDYYDYF